MMKATTAMSRAGTYTATPKNKTSRLRDNANGIVIMATTTVTASASHHLDASIANDASSRPGGVTSPALMVPDATLRRKVNPLA